MVARYFVTEMLIVHNHVLYVSVIYIHPIASSWDFPGATCFIHAELTVPWANVNQVQVLFYLGYVVSSTRYDDICVYFYISIHTYLSIYTYTYVCMCIYEGIVFLEWWTTVGIRRVPLANRLDNAHRASRPYLLHISHAGTDALCIHELRIYPPPHFRFSYRYI